MAWVEKDHNDHLVSTPCYVQGHQPADQAAQSQRALSSEQWMFHLVHICEVPIQSFILWIFSFLLCLFRSYKPNPGDEEQNPSQKEHRAEGCAGAAAAES